MLRTFGIALVNLAHFTHLVLIRGTTRVFLPLNVTINLAPSQLEILFPKSLLDLSHTTPKEPDLFPGHKALRCWSGGGARCVEGAPELHHGGGAPRVEGRGGHQNKGWQGLEH